ncbi:MAG TPA: hypothetical protein VNB50_02660 [Gaiellaceae bacterium]|jgi:hypothetical protein|nr:hypothetical protein [Gaiellaceae bacterium]
MLAALRRLVVLVAISSALTVAVSGLLGLLVGASLERAISLGFYGLGCFLMVSGFFVGNRGPARVKSEPVGPSMLPLPGFGARRLRWATKEEQSEAMSNSAVFILLGLILVVIGVLVDARHSLV